MPDLKNKPRKMELIGGKGGKDAMFKSVKQELTGDDGKSGAESDLWIIGAIVVGLFIVFMIIVMVIRMIKKGENAPKKDEKPDEDEKREDEEELFFEDLDLEELERKQQLERQQYLSSLSEEEKQELRQQIEEELDYLYELPDDWADRDSREYEDVDNRINELELQLKELSSDEDFRNSLIELGLIDEDYDGDYSEFYPPTPQDDKDEPNEKES